MFRGPSSRARRKLEPAWERVELQWHDERAHHALMALCRSAADFVEARRLYRLAAVRAAGKSDVQREADAWRWLAALETRLHERSRAARILSHARLLLFAGLLVESQVSAGQSSAKPLVALAVFEVGAQVVGLIARRKRAIALPPALPAPQVLQQSSRAA